MRLHEVTSPIKTYIARVRLKNGATVTATERTESLYFATQIFKHKFGDNNVYGVTELHEQVNELEEGTETLTPQQLQVKALSDKAEEYKQQEKALKARQQIAKAQKKLMTANSSPNTTNKRY